MFSRPKILFLVSLLFVALLNLIPTSVADLGGARGAIAPPPPCNLKEHYRLYVLI